MRYTALVLSRGGEASGPDTKNLHIMKLHLPIALLAVMFSTVAYAGGTYRPAVIVPVEDTQVLTSENVNPTTQKIIKEEMGEVAYTSDNSKPLTYTKDGLGTLVVEDDVTMVNPLFVREGTLEIKDATVKSNVKLSDGVSNLIVAGNSAALKLDNAHYTQTIAESGNYTSSITIGSDDGAGAVYLTGNSTLHTDHCLFIGRTNTTYEGAPAYVQPSYANTTGDALYTDGDKKSSYISISEGCEMSAGTQIYLDNVTVDISGENAKMVAGKRSIAEPNVRIYSSRLGTKDGVVTTVNVSDGGELAYLRGVYTGSGNAEVKVNVKGDGSSLSIGGNESYLGVGSYDYAIEEYVANNSNTQISITEGASMQVGTSVYVGYASAASIIVDGESSITQESSTEALITLMGKGSMENSGAVGIATDVDGGALTLNAGSSMAAVNLIEGDIYVNGASKTGALTLTGGTITFNLDAQVMTLADDATAAGMLTVDSLEVSGTKIVVNLSEEAFNDLDNKTFNLFNVPNEGGGADLANADIVFTNGTQSKVGTITANGGSVTVKDTKLVPEPTTATLSLLALAALAARRRRR